ncbi:MAG: hypothetical protein ACI8W8_002795, partial [Rhodothermales bacterium]
FGPNQASAPGKAIQIRLCDPFRANFFRFCDGVLLEQKSQLLHILGLPSAYLEPPHNLFLRISNSINIPGIA